MEGENEEESRVSRGTTLVRRDLGIHKSRHVGWL